MTLSVCCMTDAPLELVAAAIAPMRPFADEVVIAVDASVDPELAEAHMAFADRVVRVPYAPPFERSLAWLHAQCSGDWILRIDSDEIASSALAGRLEELTNARDVTHCWIPRRWLFPDRDTYLTDWPWLPDYQLRLVRNDPALLGFPGTVHTSVTCLGPTRYLREPIYHLDCVLRSKEERAQKAKAYNRLGDGIQLSGRSARTVSETFYVPERRGVLATAAVPPADRDALAADAGKRLLAGISGSPQGSFLVATFEEVDRYWSQRTLAPDAYAASLEVADPEISLPAGELRTLDVDVTNLGTETWGWDPQSNPPIHLSYEVRTRNGQHVSSGPRTPMPSQVRPGFTVRVPLGVHAPDAAGEYVIAVDLVHELVRWFDVAVDVVLRVGAVPRIGIVAGYSPFRHVGDDAIVEAHVRDLVDHVPEAQVVLLGEVPESLQERFGTEVAPSVHSYLTHELDSKTGSRAPIWRWVARTLSLMRAARRRRRGNAARTSSSAGESFLDTLERMDVLVAASAGGFASRYRREVLWPHAVTALATAALGRPVIFSGLTVGPFTRVSDRIIAALALRRARMIIPRDASASVRDLRRLAVPRRLVQTSVDPAVALEPASPAAVLARLEVEGPYSVIAAHADVAAAEPHLCAAIEHLAKLGIATVFIPMVLDGEFDDRIAGRKLVGVRMLEQLPPDDVVVGLVSGARVAIGTRYHLAVFAAAHGVPAVGLYDDAYGERKLGGLAAQADGLVSAMPVSASADDVVRKLDESLSRGRGSPLFAPRPLPAVEEVLRVLNERAVNGRATPL